MVTEVDGYTVEDGVITSPGKFEGESVDVLEAHYIDLDGASDDVWDCGDGSNVDYFALVTLKSGERMLINNDDSGFVSIVFRDGDDVGQRGSCVDSGVSTLNKFRS
jgi:hypothetical protein